MKVGQLEVEISVDDTKLKRGVNSAKSGLNSIENQAQSTASQLNKTVPAANNLSKGFTGVGRNAGMASIQLQQFVGQVQGGVNPMIALSQQSADLGFVLGAPLLGSIVGIGAAIGVSLLPNLANSKTAIEKLQEALENSRDTIEISSSGIAQFSEELRKLAVRSEGLAKVQIAAGIMEAAESIKIASSAIVDDITSLSQGTFLDLKQAMENSGKTAEEVAKDLSLLISGNGLTPEKVLSLRDSISRLGEMFGLSGEQALELASAFGKVAKNRDIKSIQELEKTLGSLNSQTEAGSEKLVKFSNKLIPVFNAVQSTADITSAYEQALKDLGSALDEEVDAEKIERVNSVTQELSQRLAIMKAELTGGAGEAEKLAVAFELGLSNVEKLPPEIVKQIDAIQQVEQAQKAQANAQRAEDQKTAKMKAELKAKEREERATIDSNLNEIMKLGQDRLKVINAQEKERLAALETFNQEELAMLGGMEEAKRKILADSDAQRALLDQADKNRRMLNLESIREASMTEGQIMAEQYMLELETLTESLENKELTKQEYEKLREDMARQHAEELVAIEEDAIKRKEDAEFAANQRKLRDTAGAFKNLASIMNTGSKKLFKIGKAAAKAGAIVDGIAAVQGAIKVGNKIGGPVVGAVFGAAAAIQTAVQVRKINAQQFGSAGSAVSFSGGVPAVNTQQTGQQQAQPQRNVSINLQGSNFSADQVRALIGQINEQVGDGVLVAGGSI